jgi:hypothetical protein
MTDRTQRCLKVLSNVLLFLGAVLISIVLAELVTRTLFPQVMEPHPRGLFLADPELGFVLAPSQASFHSNPEYHVRVETNAIGLRERELGPKGPGEYRLIVLGDSFTFGVGVEVDQVFTRWIENHLREAGLSHTVIVNAGVGGYGTVQEGYGSSA